MYHKQTIKTYTTMNVTAEWNAFRCQVKEQVCHLLVEKYKQLNDGLLPNFEDDEEVYVENTDVKLNFKVGVTVTNTYDDSHYDEKLLITAYVVTLDGDLYFQCGEDNELQWDEISTDELVSLAILLESKL